MVVVVLGVLEGLLGGGADAGGSRLVTPEMIGERIPP